MENKQTAVELLASLMISSSTLPFKTIDEYIEQAKALEKEQIIDAHAHGDENHTFNSSKIEEYANDYYNETYGK